MDGYAPHQNCDSVVLDASIAMRFSSVKEASSYFTPKWREHFVSISYQVVSCTPNLHQVLLGHLSARELHILRKRPFFWILHIDAPMLMRWQRHNACAREPIPLQDFVSADDTRQFNSELWHLTRLSKLRVVNDGTVLQYS